MKIGQEPMTGAAARPVRLDWRAYFNRFCNDHGGFPVLVRGRLLFRDGWIYSSTDYAGPEWPPPEDAEELLDLKTEYWSLRREALLAIHRRIYSEVESLTAAQASKSSPLQHSFSYRDDDGQVSRGTADLDISAVRVKMDWVADDIKECDEHLRGLRLLPDRGAFNGK